MSARSVRPGSSNQKGAPRSSKAASSRPAAELAEAVAQGAAQPEPGGLDALAGIVDPVSGRDPRSADRGDGGTEVECSLTVAGGVGIATTLVGGRKESGDQLSMGELVAEELFHQGEAASDQGAGVGGSPNPPGDTGALGSEVSTDDAAAGSGDTPVGGDTAAVGVVGDAPILSQGGDDDVMALQLRQQGDRPPQYVGGGGVVVALRSGLQGRRRNSQRSAVSRDRHDRCRRTRRRWSAPPPPLGPPR